MPRTPASVDDDALAPLVLAALQSMGPIGVSLRDTADFSGQWNRPMFELLGFDSAAGTPSPVQVLGAVHPDDRASLLAVYEQAGVRTSALQHSYRVVLPDGSLRWLDAHVTPLPGAGGAAGRLLGVMVDDTERRALRHEVAELREQLRLSTELGRIAIFRHDLASGQVRCNPLGWQLLGLPPQDQGVDLAQTRARLHPEDRGRVEASFAHGLATGESTEVQARYLHEDGAYRHVQLRRSPQRDMHGALTGFIGVALDISEQVEGQQALSVARDRALLAARGAGLATWEFDASRQAMFWDEQMFRLRGLAVRADTPTQQEIMSIVHPDDLCEVERVYAEARLNNGPVSYEFRVRWPDGSCRWLASRSSVICDERGQMLKRIGLNWDVTEAKLNAEAEKTRLLALRASQAKSQFLARMSHELRTPLNAVLGFAQLLQMPGGTADAAGTARKLAHIRSAGEHLLSLINDVLDLARLESGDMRVDLAPVALDQLLASTLPLVEAQAQSQGVRLRCGALPGRMLADETRLRQILLNLLSNAIKYNRSGGEVRIDSAVEAGSVQLTVSDNGQGLSPQQLEHLFEPFNRLGREQASVEGTGIGLAIVKALTERMGGSICVQSVPGLGSRFTLRLPEAREIVAPSTAEKPSVPAPSAIRGRLLYIEDNPVNVLVVEELVARRPHLQLVCEVDGTRGLARAKAMQPDLILLDMQLPDFDGHQVLQGLRADPATAAIPCIALSANAMPEDITRALQAGFADYWTKPIDFRAFMQGLDTLFAAKA